MEWRGRNQFCRNEVFAFVFQFSHITNKSEKLEYNSDRKNDPVTGTVGANADVCCNLIYLTLNNRITGGFYYETRTYRTRKNGLEPGQKPD